MDYALLVLLVTSSIAFVLMWIAGKKESAAREQQAGSIEDFLHTQNDGIVAVEPIPASAPVEKSPANIELEVRMLIDYGNTAGAIRVVREKMGLDLKDATDVVNAMERGAPIPVQGATPTAGSDPLHDEARELVAAGKIIEAIALVRERKGLDLKQAKAYVEKL